MHRCAPTIAAREAMCAQVQADTGAELVHPYTDPRVIAGQGTAAMELLGTVGALDALVVPVGGGGLAARSEEHTSELQSLMRISYAVFCLKKKNKEYTSVSQIRKQEK